MTTEENSPVKGEGSVMYEKAVTTLPFLAIAALAAIAGDYVAAIAILAIEVAVLVFSEDE